MLKELDNKYNLNCVGCDETGRGNAAGSLYVCGARLKEGFTIDDISFTDDSKKISKKKHKEIATKLKKFVDYEIVEIYPKFIDDNGISEAMTHCLNHIKNKFKESDIIFDGKANYKTGIKTFIKGDQKSSLIAAASIIAKDIKDDDMILESKKYPEYNFDTNSGYLTKHHTECIKEYGYTKIHRKSFNIKALEGIKIKEYS